MIVQLKKHLTIVIKLGTSSIVDEKTHEPLLSILSTIVETAVKLHHAGHKVIIVSSGAIGVGLRRMDLERRPKHLPKVQALAAIGQCRLMSLWDQLFGHMRQPVAQILLTRTDIADRTQYLNAQNTFIELLHMGVIPIVNENDTLAVTEIKFGDNDTLSAITAAMVQADYLFLMTDVDCLYDKNPRTHPDATAIEVVQDIASLAADTSSAGSALGTGGMSTKIVAARLATSAGVTTVITKSSKPGNIAAIVQSVEAQKAAMLNPSLSESIPPAPLHTRFLPDTRPIRDRYFWLLHGLAPHGTVYIDQGAYAALADKAGLLPVGIVDVEGHFAQQEAVRLVVVQRPSASSSSTTQPPTSTPNHDELHAPTPVPSTSASSPSKLSRATSSTSLATHTHDVHPDTPLSGTEVGRALVNYSAAEIKRIRGLKSTAIAEVLGYADSEYVALRENIAFNNASRSSTPLPM